MLPSYVCAVAACLPSPPLPCVLPSYVLLWLPACMPLPPPQTPMCVMSLPASSPPPPPLYQVDKALNVLEFHEKPPKQLLATMSIDTLEYGFGE